MNRLIPAFALPAFAWIASPVLAHPGGHAQVNLLHMLTEPDHMALVALGAGVLVLLVYHARKQP